GEQVMKTHHMPPRGEHGESADYGRMDLAVIHHL
ncbi:MAG: SpoVR family protein, partial [Pseudomonas putida]